MESLKMSDEVHEEVMRLKRAWKCKSADETMRRVLFTELVQAADAAEHDVDMLKKEGVE